jgi:uncharacterized protein YkwD
MRPARRLLCSTRSVVALGACALVASAATGSISITEGSAAGLADCTPGADWGTVRRDLADRVVALVNAHRGSIGRGPLAKSNSLQRAAEWKSLHMGHYRYMQHSDPAPPQARSVGERLAACGYGGRGYAENIAYGYATAESVMRGWLNSPGHRANMESASYNAIGVGVARGSSGTMAWTQNFGIGAQSSPPQASPTPPQPAAAKARVSQPRQTRVSRPTPVGQPLEASRLFRRAVRLKAGTKFTARIAVASRAEGTRVTTGRVRCRARAAGRLLWVGVHSFRRGLATCTFRVPHRARGSQLTGTIRVSSRGRATKRWFSRKVR